MAIRPRYLALAGALSTGIACGHGPAERSVSIGDYDTPNGAELTIALRSFDVFRPARGLSAIPGTADSRSPWIAVSSSTRAKKLDGSFRQIAVVHEPAESTASFATPKIIAWLDTAVRITGTTGKEIVVRLPNDVHVGTPPKQRLVQRVLPECVRALDDLRRSNRMPDGAPVTPP